MHASVTTHLKDSLTVKARLTPAKADGRKDRHLPSWQAWRTVAPVLDTSRKGTKWGVNSQIASVGRRFYVS